VFDERGEAVTGRTKTGTARGGRRTIGLRRRNLALEFAKTWP